MVCCSWSWNACDNYLDEGAQCWATFRIRNFDMLLHSNRVLVFQMTTIASHPEKWSTRVFTNLHFFNAHLTYRLYWKRNPHKCFFTSKSKLLRQRLTLRSGVHCLMLCSWQTQIVSEHSTSHRRPFEQSQISQDRQNRDNEIRPGSKKYGLHLLEDETLHPIPIPSFWKSDKNCKEIEKF